MERMVVIGFFALVGAFIAINVFLQCSITHSNKPYFRTLYAAQLHQSSILSAGVLDAVRNAPDESDQKSQLHGALDSNARDVRGAPFILDRVRVVDEYVAIELRSAGRDSLANTQDDVVVLLSFIQADGVWHPVHRSVVEQNGMRSDFDLKTGQPIEPPQ